MQLILDIIKKALQLTDLKNVKKSKTQFLAEKHLSEFIISQKKAKNIFLNTSEFIQIKIHKIIK